VSYPELFNVRSDFGMWCNDCRNFPDIFSQYTNYITTGAGDVAPMVAESVSRFLLSWRAATKVLETSAGLIANNAKNFELDLRQADDGLTDLYKI
ncbi:MAG: hypothetical protein ACRC0L_10245, partial [Angustibacter sp.]